MESGMVIRTIFSLLFLIQNPGSAHCQQFDCRPLSCTTKQAGIYNIELAGCRNTLDIYVYNQDFVPVRGQPITGEVEFFYNCEPPLRSTLIQYFLTNALSAKIVAPEFTYCKVTLCIGLAIITAAFDNECDPRAEAPAKNRDHETGNSRY